MTTAARTSTAAERSAALDATEGAFLALETRGFWPVLVYPPGADRIRNGKVEPSEGKDPIGKAWGAQRWDHKRLKETLDRWPDAGLGVCLGPGRGPNGAWLADIEGDGPEAEESRAILFGGEDVQTIGWSSARGSHQLISLDADRLAKILPGLKQFEQKKGECPGTYKFPLVLPGLEVRLGGRKADGSVKQLQSVVPPTLTTSRIPRVWGPCSELAEAPEAFYATLEGIARSQREAGARDKGDSRQRGGSRRATTGKSFLDAYVAKTLDDEAERVARAPEGERHVTLLGVTMNLAGIVKAGKLDAETYRRTLHDAARQCQLPEGEASELIESALEKATPRDFNRAENWTPPGDESREPGIGTANEPGRLPEIEVNHQRHVVVDQVCAALTGNPHIYKRGNSLVKVVVEKRTESYLVGTVAHTKQVEAPVIIRLTEPNVGCAITESAELYEWKTAKNGESHALNCHPPQWLTGAVTTRQHYPGMRNLASIAECPFPRPDGSIVEAAGYDPVTQTILCPSIPFLPLPTNPTREDAKRAWENIYHYFREFPFASEDDKSVVLMGLLNVIARPAIPGPVPGIVVNGNRAGCGKGLLIDSMVIPGTGRCVPTMCYPEDKEEAVKVRVSIALECHPAVHFDNLDEGSRYGNGTLDGNLTSTEINDRILGSNNAAKLPLRPAWFISGNNLSPEKDAHRRWGVCNLDSPLENPECRDDIEQTNLRAVIKQHRAEIVRDALTILKAHATAGRPKGGWALLGSFEEWDTVVRGAVWYATDRDCLATQRVAAKESPERMKKIALLLGWQSLPGGGPEGSGVTVADALHWVDQFDPDSGERKERYPILKNALDQYGRRGQRIDPVGLGMILAGLKKQTIAGLTFEHTGERHKSRLWRVSGSYTDNPDSQNAGGGRGPRGGSPDPRQAQETSHNYANTSERDVSYNCNGFQEPPPASPAPPTANGRVRGVI